MPTILIVDDEDKNLILLEAVLNTKGYDILMLKNGMDVAESVEKNIPDLVLLDIMMPGMDGFEVCQHLKTNEITKDIPVIFLSAIMDADSVVKGIELGAVDYITKPFRIPELLARVEMHIRLKKTQQALKVANDTKNKFFNIIAHDLKNPFSTLLSYSETLIKKFDRYDDERKIKMISNIHKASKLTYELLENLLDWSRQQSGLLEKKPEMIDLYHLVYSNIELVNQKAASKSIHISSSLKPDTLAFGDSYMINLVLRNLISNALKFTGANGKIQVGCKTSKLYQEITVSDSGVGIVEEKIKNLFKIDVHNKSLGTHKETGSGLGLILCKEFAEENGGKINVISKPGEGSIFSFSIPQKAGF